DTAAAGLTSTVTRDEHGVTRVVVPGHLVLHGEVAVLAQAAPRRARARERRPAHGDPRVLARIVVPVADDAERALRRRVRGDDVAAVVAEVQRPPRPLVVGEREPAGGVVLAEVGPPALERVRR